jgi:hypothetical protein
MQTFLPYPDFHQSALCLDNKRLGKQRVECLQILKALTNPCYGWQNHPAVKMWRGHEASLAQYGLIVCMTWRDKGFNDTCLDKIDDIWRLCSQVSNSTAPTWLGDTSFHDSHKSNLLRKDPVFYAQYGWSVPSNLPYIWPTNITNKTSL